MNALTVSEKNPFEANIALLGTAEMMEVLEAVYEHNSLPMACEKTGYSLRRVMFSADKDPDFKVALNTAERHLAELAEEELKRRAIYGTESAVVANGRVVYTTDENGQRVPLIERKYSDSLLKMFLESRKRETFGPKVEIVTTHKGHIALPVLSPELMDLMLAMQRGDPIELIADSAMEGKESTYEVIDAEFEEVKEPTDDDFDI